MTHYHACVWLDHREARIFGIGKDDAEEFDIHDHAAPRHIHRKADHVGMGKADIPYEFFAEIAEALQPYRAILIVGPGMARTEFAGYLVEHNEKIRSRVWGIEPMDHPTRRELIAAARKYFRSEDPMHA